MNNNCGLAKSESEMLADIKATVDSIAAKSSKGILYLIGLFKKFFGSHRLLLVCTSPGARGTSSYVHHSMNNNFKEGKSFNG